MTTNRQAGLSFKNQVLIYLLRRGMRVADPNDGETKMYDLLANPGKFTDITGLEPWVISVASINAGDVSTPLNIAATNAKMAGSEWPVLIAGRRGREIEDAYAVVPFSVMARIFAGERPISTRLR